MPDVFDPGSLPIASPREASATASPETSPAEQQPAIATANEAVPIVVAGRSVGTVTVVRWIVKPAEPPSTDASISVLVRYQADESFALDSGRWELLLVDGTEIPLTPTGEPNLLDGTLAPGERLDATLGARFTQSDENPFVAYVDAGTGALRFVVSID